MWNCLEPWITAANLPAGHVLRSLITAGAMLLFVFLGMPAHAEKGQSPYQQGRDLEARQNYESAYDAYQRADDADPRNTEYRAALTRSAPCDATAASRQAPEALALFDEAVRIDPSS